MEKINFSQNDFKDLQNLPKDLLEKILAYLEETQKQMVLKNAEVSRLEQQVEKANATKTEAIEAYQELEEVYLQQKQFMQIQSDNIIALSTDSVTRVDHEKMVNEIDTERKRVDDLLFSAEETIKEYKTEINELGKDLKTARKSATHYKQEAIKSEATSNLLARKLIEVGYTPKRQQPKRVKNITNVSIGTVINMNSSASEVEKVVEAAVSSVATGNDRIVIDSRTGLYSIK